MNGILRVRTSALANDHRAGALVGEYLGEDAVSGGAADDVGGLNAAFDEGGKVFDLGDHTACGRSARDHLAGLHGGQPVDLRGCVFGVEVDAVDVGE